MGFTDLVYTRVDTISFGLFIDPGVIRTTSRKKLMAISPPNTTGLNLKMSLMSHHHIMVYPDIEIKY